MTLGRAALPEAGNAPADPPRPEDSLPGAAPANADGMAVV